VAPDWSEQGLLFVRTSTAPTPGTIAAGTVMVAPDGGTPEPVAGLPEKVYLPTWSADGKGIAYLLPTAKQGTLTLGLFDRTTGKAVTTSITGTIGAPAWGSR
jgi:hypothetical protein